MIIMQSEIAENKWEVVILTVKERILALRLLEKQNKKPEVAKQVGFKITMKEKV